jgi:hypothetical protein
MIWASIPVPAEFVRLSKTAVRAKGDRNFAALGGKSWTRQYVLAYRN